MLTKIEIQYHAFMATFYAELVRYSNNNSTRTLLFVKSIQHLARLTNAMHKLDSSYPSWSDICIKSLCKDFS